MAWSNVLATRLRLLEPLFGGLDRMYRWHRWFAAISVAAMWWHVQTVDDVEGIRGASKSVADAAEELAGTGETLLYLLVAVSLLRWIPYRWWKITHKAMILPFVFASWHFHTSTKPYSNSSAWGRWFQALMLIGIAAWAYRVLWLDIVRRGRRYTVRSLSRRGTITSLELAPLGRPIRHRVGQFAFLRAEKRGLAEPHAFTIASHPSEDALVFHIKELGDWSRKLDRLSVGDSVRVEGPYGGLELFPRQHEGPALWIAGGVGITPFLGAASDVRAESCQPHLIYAVRSREDAVGLDVLERARDAGRISLQLCVSSEGRRLSGDDLRAAFGYSGLRGAHVVMCGPDSLVRDMTRTARVLGADSVHVEAFDIRTGVGPDLSLEIEEQISLRLPSRR